MKEKIKVVIADDEKAICDLLEKALKDHEDIEILGIVNTKEEEIQIIDELKPDIVITDLLRNNEYVGYDIIKKYELEEYSPMFLLFTAAPPSYVFTKCKNVGGYIQKLGVSFDKIVVEVRRIKVNMEIEKLNDAQKQEEHKDTSNLFEFIKESIKELRKRQK